VPLGLNVRQTAFELGQVACRWAAVACMHAGPERVGFGHRRSSGPLGRVFFFPNSEFVLIIFKYFGNFSKIHINSNTTQKNMK
jgi:hypothetical protein